eukprot:9701818-Lingulodinium_polyedra.AAC.1
MISDLGPPALRLELRGARPARPAPCPSQARLGGRGGGLPAQPKRLPLPGAWLDQPVLRRE